jgi:hypothetical protein
MKFIISTVIILFISSCTRGQNTNIEWYSETESNGVIIQNSYPKGGPYTGPTKNNCNHSYLVFFTRVINETDKPFEIAIHFSADSIEIPNSTDTYVKLFLPQDTMTLEKENLFSYGVTELESLDKSTNFQRKVDPGEDCLFYVVGIYYQTKAGEWSHNRGGNRAEFILKEQDLFYRMPPQIDSLPCGNIIFDK